MIFRGPAEQCAALVADLNRELGYPRRYTQSDLDVGTLVRHGGGRHTPLASLLTSSAARPRPIDVDANGDPTSTRRLVGFKRLSPALRSRVAWARVLRLLNSGGATDLESIPGIGPALAADIIALRPIASADELPARTREPLRRLSNQQAASDLDTLAPPNPDTNT